MAGLKRFHNSLSTLFQYLNVDAKLLGKAKLGSWAREGPVTIPRLVGRCRGSTLSVTV